MPSVARPGGVQIAYEAVGEGPAIALAHGFGVDSGMWWPQRAPLSERHRLILWDARGHGGSSTPAAPEAYSMPLFATDLDAVLTDAGIDSNTIIGGMSFGGQIALQYAVDYPARTRALILSDSAPRGPSQPDGIEPPGVSGAFLAMAQRPDLTPALPSLTVPVLVLYGEHDQRLIGGVARLANGLPQRRVVCLTGCTHGTSAQRPREWTQAVLDFLGDIEAGRPISGEVTI